MQAFYSANLESIPGGGLCPPCCNAWLMAADQQTFPLNVPPVCQRDEPPFAITPPSWFLSKMGKRQHEMHPFAFQCAPCYGPDLSVLCCVELSTSFLHNSTKCMLLFEVWVPEPVWQGPCQLSRKPEVKNSQADKCDNSLTPFSC